MEKYSLYKIFLSRAIFNDTNSPIIPYLEDLCEFEKYKTTNRGYSTLSSFEYILMLMLMNTVVQFVFLLMFFSSVSWIREDIKYFFADFVRKGVPPPPFQTQFLQKFMN